MAVVIPTGQAQKGPGMGLEPSGSLSPAPCGFAAGLTARELSAPRPCLCCRKGRAVEGHLHRLHEREVRPGVQAEDGEMRPHIRLLLVMSATAHLHAHSTQTP